MNQKIPERIETWSHFAIISNPHSGSSRGEELQTLAEATALGQGKTLTFIPLGPDLEHSVRAAQLAGAQVLVAAGGDGTVATVATLAYRLNMPLGVIASGTANLLARDLGLPLQAEAALNLLFRKPRSRMIDLVAIEKRVYLCHISVGTYSWISCETPAPAKKRFGRLAYVWNALRLLSLKKLWTFHMDIDGVAIRRRASTLMITNTSMMGAGAMRWHQKAAIDDGIVEICVIRARSLQHYLGLLLSYIRRSPHPTLQEVVHVQKYATIKASSPLPVMGDGERITDGGFRFDVHPRALQVLVAGDEKTEEGESSKGLLH